MADPIMEIAWRDFVLWAATNEDIVAEFNAATGRHYGAKPTSVLDAWIDDVTGKTDDDAKAFTLWVTEHHWGIDEAPDAIKAELQTPAPIEPAGRSRRDG